MFINLLMNAAESHVRPGNPITIRMGREPVSEDAPTEMRIWVEIADSGAGIASSIRNRVFEPFYTTKKPGEGVGLGLAISAGIAKELGGRLLARNAEPRGAIFELQLPRAMAGANQAAE